MNDNKSWKLGGWVHIIIILYFQNISYSNKHDNGLLQIRPTHWYDIRHEVSQGVSMCPKTVSRCPESISRCPESVSRCPHLFQAHIVTSTSSIMVFHVTPCGVSRCIHMCRNNLLFQKLNICLGGLKISVSRCPSFPHPYICKNWCSRHATLCHDTW